MNTTLRGQQAETLATRYLERRGYRIIGRNIKNRGGELDLVAIDRDTLVFIEVRSRGDARHGDPAATIGWRKRRRVARAARAYLARHPTMLPNVRFDVVAITAGVVRLLVDAWRP
jgi:putative endonuclease